MPNLVNPYRFGAGGGGGAGGGFITLAESTSNTPPWTFTAIDIGAAAANRVVVVGTVVYDAGANQVTSVTIGGNAMTKAIDTSTAAAIGTGRVAGIYYLVVAAGTTATIVVAASNTPAISAAIAVWALYPASSTPVDAVASQGSTVASVTASAVAVTTGGVLCGIHQHDNNNATNWSWSGIDPLTVETDQALGDSGIIWSVATIRVAANTTANSLTAGPTSGTPNQSIACASWGP
jgi:hypothetical protein